MSRTNSDFEGIAGLYGVDADLSQHAPMEEGIARPIEEFDEAKSLLGTEPFDGPTDRWTGRGLEGRSVELGSGAENTRLWLVGISVEVATPRITEILMSHFGS